MAYAIGSARLAHHAAASPMQRRVDFVLHI